MGKDVYVEGGIRLQKALSQAGIASRCAAKALIAEEQARVDGQVVRSRGTRIDPHKQSVHIGGERVFFDEAKHVVIAVNRPVDVVSTMNDPEGRLTLADLVVDYPERLCSVDRLDINTSGLLLLTDDGEFANRLAHLSYEVPKTYVARTHGEVGPYVRRRLMEGIELEDSPIKANTFRVTDTYGDITSIEVIVHEGRNHLVRRMMNQVGYPIRELVCTAFGPIHLGYLQLDNSCRVKDNALKTLHSCVGL